LTEPKAPHLLAAAVRWIESSILIELEEPAFDLRLVPALSVLDPNYVSITSWTRPKAMGAAAPLPTFAQMDSQGGL